MQEVVALLLRPRPWSAGSSPAETLRAQLFRGILDRERTEGRLPLIIIGASRPSPRDLSDHVPR